MTEADWKNIKALIVRTPITGEQAIVVANLLIKIEGKIAECHAKDTVATDGGGV